MTSVLAGLSLLILTACTAEPLVRYETVTVTRDRYVEIPDDLTEPLAPPEIPGAIMTWGEIAGLGIEYRSRWLQCERDRAKIRRLGDRSNGG